MGKAGIRQFVEIGNNHRTRTPFTRFGIVLAPTWVMAKQLLLDRNLCSELVSVARVARDGRAESVIGNLEEIGEHSALVLADSPIAAEKQRGYRMRQPRAQRRREVLHT